MTRIPAWRRYLRFWRPNIAEDVDDEIRFHTEMRVREYLARGMSEDDAGFEALDGNESPAESLQRVSHELTATTHLRSSS
jgi:hypothetical protein